MASNIPDRVGLDLVMELVEMQVGPDPGQKLIALALGVNGKQVERYQRRGSVPRDRAEWLYDRLARGIPTHKPKLDPFEWPLNHEEMSERSRRGQLKWAAKQRKAS